jgi:hypothetical protein
MNTSKPQFYFEILKVHIGQVYKLINKQEAQGPGAQLTILRNGEHSSDFFRKKEICSVGISAFLVVLHCIISQMSR